MGHNPVETVTTRVQEVRQSNTGKGGDEMLTIVQERDLREQNAGRLEVIREQNKQICNLKEERDDLIDELQDLRLNDELYRQEQLQSEEDIRTMIKMLTKYG